MKLRIKILIGFMSIIGLMGLLGIVTYSNFIEINKQFEFLVEHDLEVLQNAQKLQKYIVDAETGQRGFIIVGEESFLEPYYSGIAGFNELVKIEKQLVSDNPSQVEKLEKIEELFVQWNEEAAIPEIELARITHTTDINAKNLEELLKQGTGKRILDELRIILDESIEREIEEGELEQQLLLYKISKELVDRETGQRGFLITGDELFLEPYIDGNKNLKIHLNDLLISVEEEEEEEHVEDDVHPLDEHKDESKIIAKIITLSKRWETESAIPEIEFRKKLNENPTIYDVSILLRSETGKNILDNIRVEFKEFIQIENELKDKRFETVQEIKKTSEINIVIFVTIATIVGVGIAMTLSHSINISLKLLILGTDHFRKGKFEPIPLSGDDEISNLSKSFNEMALDLKNNIERLEIQKNELDQMNQEMKKTEVLKEEFVAMISHELKTPITPILMWAEALQDKKMLGELNEKQIKATKTIYKCATELSGLISDIFDSYKLDLEKIEFNEHEINLMELMSSTKETAEKLIGRYNIIIENTTNENITVYSDKKRIDQVFKNLITNAIDFVEQDSGKIEINASVKGEDVEFMVKDNGIGIQKEFQEELFKKFYQIDTSAKRKHGGSGLGLAICHGMVNGMKGKIWVESVHGEGTTFYFSLPIVNKTTK